MPDVHWQSAFQFPLKSTGEAQRRLVTGNKILAFSGLFPIAELPFYRHSNLRVDRIHFVGLPSSTGSFARIGKYFVDSF